MAIVEEITVLVIMIEELFILVLLLLLLKNLFHFWYFGGDAYNVFGLYFYVGDYDLRNYNFYAGIALEELVGFLIIGDNDWRISYTSYTSFAGVAVEQLVVLTILALLVTRKMFLMTIVEELVLYVYAGAYDWKTSYICFAIFAVEELVAFLILA